MRLRSGSSASPAPSPVVPSKRKSDWHQDTPQREGPNAAACSLHSGNPQGGGSETQCTSFATPNLPGPPSMSSSLRDPASASPEVVFAMQFDGAMEIEPANAAQPVLLPEQISPVSPSLNSVDDQDIRPASPHLVDVDMGEPEEAALQMKLRAESAPPDVDAGKEDRHMDHMDYTAVTPSIPGTANLEQEKEDEPPLPLQEILRPANAAQHRTNDLTPHSSTEAHTEQIIVAEAPSAGLTEGEMMDVNSGDNNLEPEERNKNQQSALPHPSIRQPKYGSTKEFRLREERSVQSYLAWLQHRQTRFPTTPPNSSEVILVAEKLNRSEAKVYDEILYRWGLETNSKCGAWYRQNRLTVLGEDPRFDEETMGQWEAWVKEGRDILAGRES